MNGKERPTEEERLLEAVRSAFAPPDPDVQQRLARMRREAVRIAEESTSPRGRIAWFTGGRSLAALTAAAGFTLAVWLGIRVGNEPPALLVLDEPEVAVVQELELLEELEFLAWLEEEPVGAG